MTRDDDEYEVTLWPHPAAHTFAAAVASVIDELHRADYSHPAGRSGAHVWGGLSDETVTWYDEVRRPVSPSVHLVVSELGSLEPEGCGARVAPPPGWRPPSVLPASAPGVVSWRFSWDSPYAFPGRLPAVAWALRKTREGRR